MAIKKIKNQKLLTLIMVCILPLFLSLIFTLIHPVIGTELLETLDSASGEGLTWFCKLIAGKAGLSVVGITFILFLGSGEKRKPIFGKICFGAFIAFIVANVYITSTGESLINSTFQWIIERFTNTASSTTQ